MTEPDWPLHHIRAGVLDIGDLVRGPRQGRAVVLLHGFPYDVRSFHQAAPLLTEAGFRVVVPYLRGHGPTRFRDAADVRSGQQAALGADLVELLDALGLERPILAGYDWGGRAACVLAALNPERVGGLVSVNGYLIQDIAAAGLPADPELESGFWYFWYFSTERGRAGLAAHRRAVARVIWRRNSPEWQFDEEQLVATAESFDNPDYVDVVIHSYRHRLGLAAGDPRYADMEAQLATLPPISVPTITLDGAADGNFPATDGQAAARHFTGWREHRVIPHAGHNLPAETPLAFADAVMTVAKVCHNSAA